MAEYVSPFPAGSVYAQNDVNARKRTGEIPLTAQDHAQLNSQGFFGQAESNRLRQQQQQTNAANAQAGAGTDIFTQLAFDAYNRNRAKAMSGVHRGLSYDPGAYTGPVGAAQRAAEALAKTQQNMSELRSKWETQYKENPYTANYANNLFAKGALGQIQRNFADQGRNLGQNLAARGLTQAGADGFTNRQFNNLDVKRQEALAGAATQADLRTNELRNDWDSRRAAALDAFNLAQAQGNVAAGQAALNGARLSALLPYEVAGAGLANQATQQGLDQRAQLFPGQLQAQGLGVTEAQLRNQLLGLEAGNAQWDHDNPTQAFLRDAALGLIPAAGRVGGMYFAGGLGGAGAAGGGLYGGYGPGLSGGLA